MRAEESQLERNNDRKGRRRHLRTLVESPLWKAGKLYTVEQDEDGYLYIVRYAVEFKF
jgi:hypothetical protein